MAITSADADRMIQTAKDNNVILGVIFQSRWNDASRAAKKAIEEGQIGKVFGARAFITWDRSDEYYKNSDWKGTWDKEGGGVLIDQAIHTIDLGQWLIGDEVDWVKGTWETRCHHFIDVDDTAEFTVSFKNGVKFSVYANNYYPINAPVFLEIVGDKGMIHITADKAKIMTENTTFYVQQAKGLVTGMEYWGKSHCLQISDFYRDVQNGVQPEIDGHVGKVAMDIVLAAYKSGRTGERIQFPFKD
jgi:predicted dehydrogenase